VSSWPSPLLSVRCCLPVVVASDQLARNILVRQRTRID
jgi:hypothetical protein